MAHGRVLVIQHEDEVPLALFDGWLRRAECALDVRAVHRGEEIPALTPYDGLVVLGGTMDADDDAGHPWLPLVRARIVQAAEDHLPTLGICLGHQLAALALGGEVGRSPYGRAVGVRQVDWEPAVLLDPLLAGFAGEDRAVFWNQDVVLAMPPGGEVLATALDGTVQAARFAPTVWGVQFHPEVDQPVVAAWARGTRDELERLGRTEEDAVAEVVTALPELVDTWRPFAEAYARMVAGRAAAHDLSGWDGHP